MKFFGKRRSRPGRSLPCCDVLESRRLLSAAYTVVDLGAFSSGNGSSFATALNSHGDVVGYSSVANGITHPFLYSDGALRDLNPSGGDSEAWGINDSGQVVGKNGSGFLYSNGTMQSIGRLPGGNTSFAYAINNSGQVAGDSLTSDPAITHAFLYSNGTVQDLGTLGGSQSNAFGINNHGDVVGLAYGSDGVSHAFVYSNGQIQNIGQLWGPAASVARAVNDNGVVVGYGYFLGLLPRHAFEYSNGTITDLQTLGGISSAARGINSQGEIVGDSNTPSGADHAFIDTNGTMQDLNSMIDSSSNWVLQQASAINDSGEIAGTGTIDGKQHAFLLKPIVLPQFGSISGVVFNDANSNGADDAGEAGLAGWNVFVDVNGNGKPDAGEPATTTASDGSYTISGITPGSYSVGEVVKSGFTPTAPAGGLANISVVANQTAHASFGNAAIVHAPADTTPPSAQITASDIAAASSASQTITVVYTDNVAVNAASITPANITVTGPAGGLTVTSATASDGNGPTVTAIYTVAAPAGGWATNDNGSYSIALNANQVSDTSGNVAGAAFGSFTVNIAASVGNGTDTSFNGGQAVPTDFVTEAILTEPDGKLIAVGRSGDLSASTSRGVIKRFNSDGSIDQGFGNGGAVLTQAGANEAYFAVVMQDADHFIVAGTSGGDFVLARYNLSGRLDTTFGSGGEAITDFGADSDTARSIAIAPGGMIVAGGDSGANFAFARYDANGNLDPNFAQNGRQLYGLGDGTSNGLGSIVVESDGRIVAVGAQDSSVVAMRLTASGEADGTFGDGGLTTIPGLVARTDLGTPDRSEGLALQPDGEILVANRTSSGQFGLVRLNSSGSLDTTFGINGLVTASFGGDDDADTILLQSSGPIIVIGTSLQNGNPQTAVGAFDASGSPISGFGNNGLLLLPNDVSSLTAQAHPIDGVMPKALHVGDIVLRAFGTVTSDGRVIVGTSNEAVAATTSSTLRRLLVPGATVATGKDDGTLLGSFGVVNGKLKKFTTTDQDGTKVTFALTGGTGQIYRLGDRFNLIIDDMGKGVVLTVIGRGGDGRVSFSNVTISGTLRSMNARNSDIFGTLHVTGAIGALAIGNISGGVWSGSSIGLVKAGKLSGNLFATGSLGKLKFSSVGGTIASGGGAISSIFVASLDNARVLSGANLGADGAVGGAGLNADSYGEGSIGTIKVTGAVTSSVIEAGVNPVDQTFGNADDTLSGSAAADAIRSISAKSADRASRFEAGNFGKILLPGKVNPMTDMRFLVL